MTNSILRHSRAPPATTTYRFCNSWKRLACTLACLELNGANEQEVTTLHANLVIAYERHVDLILGGENTTNYVIDEANTFVESPVGVLTRELLLEGMTDGKHIQRTYKDLKTVINNHLTPRYRNLLNPDGSIPSGKQKKDILLQTCQEYHEASSKSKKTFSFLIHEPFEFLTFQLLGPPSDRCASEFSLSMSSGPNSPEGVLHRTPELSRAAKRKAMSPAQRSPADEDDVIQHNLYQVFATEVLVGCRKNRLIEINDALGSLADSQDAVDINLREKLKREKLWMIENPSRNPVDYPENSLPVVDIYEV
jgi:hypothetical protein